MAFGGVYAWTLVPTGVALAAAMWMVRPRLFAPGCRAIDAAIICVLAAIAIQLIPLPPAVRDALSPNAHRVDQLLRFDMDLTRSRPLTTDARETVGAAIVAAMAAMAFWTARSLGGDRIRPLARGVAWTGLAVSAIAIVTRASSPKLLYGIWRAGEAARPYGPFVNRNHMGTWLILALPFVVGYMLARADRRARRQRPAFDTPMLWLGAAAGAMFVAALVSLSRSTAVGLAAAGVFGSIVGLPRGGRAARWILAATLVSIALALSMRQTIELAGRFEDTHVTATWDRPAIWRETLSIVRDFPATGVGVGAFEDAMLVYQRADRRLFFNQAHDQYLQFAAEGGVLLLVPLAGLAIAFAVRTARLARDRSPMFWIRAGALAGVIGVAVQSIWETGLRMPANALLFAVLCAVAARES